MVYPESHTQRLMPQEDESMFRNTLLILIACLTTSAAHAALPPYYQSVREIQAILENREIAAKLGSGRAITSIAAHDRGFTVIAGECGLDVEVRYLPPENPPVIGPVRFEIRPGQVNCLPGEE